MAENSDIGFIDDFLSLDTESKNDISQTCPPSVEKILPSMIKVTFRRIIVISRIFFKYIHSQLVTSLRVWALHLHDWPCRNLLAHGYDTSLFEGNNNNNNIK